MSQDLGLGAPDSRARRRHGNGADPVASLQAGAGVVPRPIRVAGVYPAFEPRTNEWAQIWRDLAAAGLVECRIIAGSQDYLKGQRSAVKESALPGLEIRRIEGVLNFKSSAPSRIDDELIAWAAAIRPDVIVSEMEFLAHFGRRIQRRWPAPHVLQVENWFDERILRRREYLGVPALRGLAARLRRWRYGRDVDRVLTASPRDHRDPRASEPGSRVDYVPWPHPPIASGLEAKPLHGRHRDQVIYIGSMSRWKGVENLERYVAALLEAEPHVRVKIVGPAVDDTARNVLRSLSRWGERCDHVHSLPRTEALAAIGESLCVFCPSDLMGWGLVGDAWNMATPIIGVGEFYELQGEANSLIAPDPASFVSQFRRLRHDPFLWETLAAAGAECVRTTHSIDHVKRALLESLHRAIDGAKRPPTGA